MSRFTTFRRPGKRRRGGMGVGVVRTTTRKARVRKGGGSPKKPLSPRVERLLSVMSEQPRLGRELAPLADLTAKQFGNDIRRLSARSLVVRDGDGWRLA